MLGLTDNLLCSRVNSPCQIALMRAAREIKITAADKQIYIGDIFTALNLT